MSAQSHIEWTDATWPIVAGCEFESPECTRCYALLDSWRMAHNPNPKIHRAFFGTVDKTEKGQLVWSGIVRTLPERLTWPLRWKAPRRIFVCNLADLFHPKVPFEFIAAAFGVMAMAHWHTFQVLTKHPARMRKFFEWIEVDGDGAAAASMLHAFGTGGWLSGKFKKYVPSETPAWPLANLHLGVTAGDQKRADERIPHLMRCPAARHFLSYEPAIGELNLQVHLAVRRVNGDRFYAAAEGPDGGRAARLDWVIAGGESGKRARPASPAWFRKVRDDCAAAGVPFHFKQWGAWAPCETDVDMDSPRPRRAVQPLEESVDLSPDRGYQVIQLHGQEFVKVGKKVAGRTLDGLEHNGAIA